MATKSTKQILLDVVNEIGEESEKVKKMADKSSDMTEVTFIAGISQGYLNVIRMFKKHLDTDDEAT